MSIEVHESGTDLTAVCHGTANLVRIHDKERKISERPDENARKSEGRRMRWQNLEAGACEVSA